jgi:hypothetical protein
MVKGWSQAPATIWLSGPGHGQTLASHLRDHNGWHGDAQIIGLDLAVPDHAAHPRHGDLAGEIVAHVFFARIGQLDRRALHLDGDLGGLLDHLVFQPVAETAAHVERMDGNPFRIDAGDLADIVLDEARDLCTGPDLGAVFIDPDDGADRFERGMGQVGRAVFGADDLAGFGNRDLDIAVIALAAVERILGEAVGKRLPVLLHRGRERGRAPFGFDRLGGLEGAPGVVGDGGDTAGDRDHLADTAHLQRLAGVKAVHRSGLGRVELDRGMDHAFDLVINAIALRAGGLGDDVDALHRLADQAPLGRDRATGCPAAARSPRRSAPVPHR